MMIATTVRLPMGQAQLLDTKKRGNYSSTSCFPHASGAVMFGQDNFGRGYNPGPNRFLRFFGGLILVGLGWVSGQHFSGEWVHPEQHCSNCTQEEVDQKQFAGFLKTGASAAVAGLGISSVLSAFSRKSKD